MFGYAAPAGAPLFGGPEWQEVQLKAASGEAATWHVWQAGPDLTVGANSSWQVEQPFVKVAGVAWKCVLSKNGTSWLAPPLPGPPAWQASAPQVAVKQVGPVAPGGSAWSVAPWQDAVAQEAVPFAIANARWSTCQLAG
jgi:hypothetical protein